MRRYLKIFAAFVLSALFGLTVADAAFSDKTAPDEAICFAEEADSGHISPADDDGWCYTDWNTLSLSDAESLTVSVQIPGFGENVRCQTGQHVQSHLKTSFARGGKVVSIVLALRFHSSTGLYPSGNYSFSHHLASLRKLRC